jgi:hypothetical protein
MHMRHLTGVPKVPDPIKNRIRDLVQSAKDGGYLMAKLVPAIREIFPRFDYNTLGFKTCLEMVETLSDIVRVERTPSKNWNLFLR